MTHKESNPSASVARATVLMRSSRAAAVPPLPPSGSQRRSEIQTPILVMAALVVSSLTLCRVPVGVGRWASAHPLLMEVLMSNVWCSWCDFAHELVCRPSARAAVLSVDGCSNVAGQGLRYLDGRYGEGFEVSPCDRSHQSRFGDLLPIQLLGEW